MINSFSSSSRSYQPVQVPSSLVFWSTSIHVLFYCLIGWFVSQIWDEIQWYRVLQCAYLANCTALFTHWLGHQKIRSVSFLHRWYQAHIAHHVKEYPPTRFLSDDDYRPAPVNNAYAYRPMLLMNPLFMCWFHSQWSIEVYLLHFLPGAFLLYVADLLHQQIHVRGSRWERYDWFLQLRSLHYLHHVGDFQQNFAMADFFIDVLTFHFQRP
jgi:hypothetical protein